MFIPFSLQNFVAIDYEEKLSQEEKIYLEKFDKEFYFAKFDDNPLHPPSLQSLCLDNRRAYESDISSGRYSYYRKRHVKKRKSSYCLDDYVQRDLHSDIENIFILLLDQK